MLGPILSKTFCNIIMFNVCQKRINFGKVASSTQNWKIFFYTNNFKFFVDICK